MRPLMVTLLLVIQLYRPAWAQDIGNWAPELTLQEFKDSLKAYDRVIIDITVAQNEDWRDELAHLKQAIPIRNLNEDGGLRNDRIELTLDLKRKDERGLTIHEEYSLSYQGNNNEFSTDLRNPFCWAASIKQKARFGLFWSSLPDYVIEHGCLAIGPRKIKIPQVVTLIVESIQEGSEQTISVGRRALLDTVAQKAAVALGLPEKAGNYILFEVSELHTIDTMADDYLNGLCGVFASGYSYNANDRISQFVSKEGTRIGVIQRDEPQNDCIKTRLIPTF